MKNNRRCDIMIDYYISKYKYELFLKFSYISSSDQYMIDDMLDIKNNIIDVVPEIFYEIFEKDEDGFDILGFLPIKSSEIKILTFYVNYDKMKIYNKVEDKSKYFEYKKRISELLSKNE